MTRCPGRTGLLPALAVLSLLFISLSYNSLNRQSSTQRQLTRIPFKVRRTNYAVGPFRDEYFEPILDTFRNREAYILRREFRNGSVPKVFFVSSMPLEDRYWSESFSHITMNECPLPCILTDDKAQQNSSDAILIYLREIKSAQHVRQLLPTRDLQQPWIVHSNESPVRATDHKLDFRSMNGIFNRTMLYRRDADIVWTHGFVVPKDEARYLPPSWHVEAPPFVQKPFVERKMAVAFISNCANTGGRMEYIKQLRKFITVDIVGKCGNIKCGNSRYVQHHFMVETDGCYKRAAQKYLFYLSFENSICEDYVTEKAYNIQFYPIVPVVFGGADYTKLFPPNSYINAIDYSPAELAGLLTSLATDEKKYQAKLAWRTEYEVSTVSVRRIYCQLCTRLYDPDFYEENTYEDFYDWFVTKSECLKYEHPVYINEPSFEPSVWNRLFGLIKGSGETSSDQSDRSRTRL